MSGFTVNCLTSGVTTCSRNWIVDVKCVCFHRLYYVLGGEAVYKDNERTFPLEQGCLYLFPIQKEYRITHNLQNPFRCVWFHIVTAPCILDTVTSLNVRDEPVAYHLLKALEAVHERPEISNGLKKQLLESLMLTWNEKSGFLLSHDERLAAVLGYIHDHYGENLSDAVLSKAASLDVSYFIRFFKKALGVTPQEYVSDYRFKKALLMLQKGLLVGDVSEKSGYQDPKAFSRAFKKHTGISPSKCKPGQYLQP